MPEPWTTLLTVAAQGLLLLVLARLLFAVVVGAVADRRGKGLWLGLLRIPGNVVHEYSHCLGFLLAGYRVHRVLICIFDPRGRGSCQPGAPWLPWAIPRVALGLAAIMPLLAGSVALLAIGWQLGVVTTPLIPGHDPSALGLVQGAAQFIGAINWQRWQTYVFLYLALSIGAELAPSDTDLRHAVPALLLGIAALWLVMATLQHLPGLTDTTAGLARAIRHAAAWLGQVWTATLMVTAAVIGLTVLPSLLWRAARR